MKKDNTCINPGNFKQQGRHNYSTFQSYFLIFLFLEETDSNKNKNNNNSYNNEVLIMH